MTLEKEPTLEEKIQSKLDEFKKDPSNFSVELDLMSSIQTFSQEQHYKAYKYWNSYNEIRTDHYKKSS